MKLIGFIILGIFICLLLLRNKLEGFNPLNNMSTDEKIDIYMGLLNISYDICERSGVFLFLDGSSLKNYYENHDIFYTWESLNFGISDMDYYRLKPDLQDELADPMYTYEINEDDNEHNIKIIHKPTKMFTTITMYQNTNNGIRRHGYNKNSECSEFITPDILYPLKEDIVFGRRIYYPNKPKLLIDCF